MTTLMAFSVKRSNMAWVTMRAPLLRGAPSDRCTAACSVAAAGRLPSASTTPACRNPAKPWMCTAAAALCLVNTAAGTTRAALCRLVPLQRGPGCNVPVLIVSLMSIVMNFPHPGTADQTLHGRRLKPVSGPIMCTLALATPLAAMRRILCNPYHVACKAATPRSM